MRKNMIGDVVVVVIDEIGEVTFVHDVMNDLVGLMNDKETYVRAIAAVLELIEVAERAVGVGQVGAKLTAAKELLLVNFEFHVNRLSEQNEFQKSARKGW